MRQALSGVSAAGEGTYFFLNSVILKMWTAKPIVFLPVQFFYLDSKDEFKKVVCVCWSCAVLGSLFICRLFLHLCK